MIAKFTITALLLTSVMTFLLNSEAKNENIPMELSKNALRTPFTPVELTANFERINIPDIQDNLNLVKVSLAQALNSYRNKKNLPGSTDDTFQPITAPVTQSSLVNIDQHARSLNLWITENPTVNVKQITCYSGHDIQILVFIRNGVRLQNSPEFEKSRPVYLDWQVPSDEIVTQVEFSVDGISKGFTLITDKGTKSPLYGSIEGAYKLMTLPNGYKPLGVFGRNGTTSDRLGLILGNIVHISDRQTTRRNTIKTDDGQQMELISVELE